jgi:hypothetical protein
MIVESPSVMPQLGFGELYKTSFFDPPKPKIIGLSGKARSGKDTAAGMLKTAFNAKTVAFADPIRDAMRVLFDFNEEHFNGSLKEVVVPWIGKSPRQLMQTLGTEWGRNIVNNDIWRILAARKIEQITEDSNHAVVTDVRFENEAKMIRSMGGRVWHIVRDSIPTVSAHASEAGIAFHDGDVIIHNNGTLKDLFDSVCDSFLEVA